jgi:hypothetical protein
MFGALSTLPRLGDSDVFWHLAQGAQTLRNGLARTDVFSWTATGTPVLIDQWLGQVGWYAAYAAAGWTGIAALRGIAVALVVTFIVAAALRAQPRPLVAVIASLPAIALSRYSWTERPELFGLACFSALVLIVRAAYDRPRTLLLAPPLLVLWANLHASFVLGVAVVAIASVTIAARRADARRFAFAALVLSFAATLLTPSGPLIWTSAGGHFLSPPRFIQEEGAPDVTQLYGQLFVFAIAAVLATAALARPVDVREVFLLVPVLFVSLTAARHTPFFAIASAPYLASHGPQALGALARMLRLRGWSAPPSRAVPSLRVDIATAIVGLALVLGAARVATGGPDLSGYPVAALPSLPTGSGLLSEYDWGGFLIWYAPGTPVFIDGRLFPFLPAAMDDYRAIVGLHPGWQDVIARRDVRALLLRPSEPLAARARELGWRAVSTSESYVLLVRP